MKLPTISLVFCVALFGQCTAAFFMRSMTNPVAPTAAALQPEAPTAAALQPEAPTAAAANPVVPNIAALKPVVPNIAALKPVVPSTAVLKSVIPNAAALAPAVAYPSLRRFNPLHFVLASLGIPVEHLVEGSRKCVTELGPEAVGAVKTLLRALTFLG